MKIIVAGGRDFTDMGRMQSELAKLTEEGVLPEYVELVCGMAKGADLTAKDLFERVGFTVNKRPADWKNLDAIPCVVKRNKYGEYNVLAGINRNHAMGDEADLLVAFWDGKSTGTKDMIDYMRKLGKPVHVLHY